MENKISLMNLNCYKNFPYYFIIAIDLIHSLLLVECRNNYNV